MITMLYIIAANIYNNHVMSEESEENLQRTLISLKNKIDELSTELKKQEDKQQEYASKQDIRNIYLNKNLLDIFNTIEEEREQDEARNAKKDEQYQNKNTKALKDTVELFNKHIQNMAKDFMSYKTLTKEQIQKINTNMSKNDIDAEQDHLKQQSQLDDVQNLSNMNKLSLNKINVEVELEKKAQENRLKQMELEKESTKKLHNETIESLSKQLRTLQKHMNTLEKIISVEKPKLDSKKNRFM
tara:strand:+ start:9040 stop:9768 length:729 start_codon:yes stop_codon:yes gene_type:complete